MLPPSVQSWTWQRYALQAVAPFLVGGLALSTIDKYFVAQFDASAAVISFTNTLSLYVTLFAVAIISTVLTYVAKMELTLSIDTNQLTSVFPVAAAALMLHEALRHSAVSETAAFAVVIVVIGNAALVAAFMQKSGMLPVSIAAFGCILYFVPLQLSIKSFIAAAIIGGCLITIAVQIKQITAKEHINEWAIILCSYCIIAFASILVGRKKLLLGYVEIKEASLHRNAAFIIVILSKAVAAFLFHFSAIILMRRVALHSILVSCLALAVLTASGGNYVQYSFVIAIVCLVIYALFCYSSCVSQTSQKELTKTRKLNKWHVAPLILLLFILGSYHAANVKFAEAPIEEAKPAAPVITLEEKLSTAFDAKLNAELAKIRTSMEAKLSPVTTQQTQLQTSIGNIKADIAAFKRKLNDNAKLQALTDRVDELANKIEQLNSQITINTQQQTNDKQDKQIKQGSESKPTKQQETEKEDKAIYISFVIASRNDIVKYDPESFQRTLNVLGYLVSKYKLEAELVVVEWNPPDDRPSLASQYDFSIGMPVSIITVGEEIHSLFDNDLEEEMLQYHAKNAGIRRAKGKYIALMNQDMILNDALVEFLSEKQLSSKSLYRVHTSEVYSRPETEDAEQLLKLLPTYDLFVHGSRTIQKNPKDDWWKQEQKQLHESPENIVNILFNRGGDFLVVSKDTLVKFHAYEEDTKIFNQDITLICSLLSKLKQQVLFPPMAIYHQYHMKRAQAPRTDYLTYCRTLLEGTAYSEDNNGWGLEGAKLPIQTFD